MFRVEDTNEGRKEWLEDADVEDFNGQSVQSEDVVAFFGNVGYDNRNCPIKAQHEETFQQNTSLALGVGEIFFVLAQLAESDCIED